MVSPAISAFVGRFYELSDDGSKHSEYADQFSYPSASSSSPGTAFFFQIGPMAPASTREGVLAWRNKAWESVARRKHTIHDVYVLPAGKGDMDAKAKDGSVPGELMLYGRVDYEKKDGSKAAATWGGRMVFDTDLYASSGELKMTHYRVWITPDA
ncbi:hypothetical protein FA10DRAFT_267540 [Acaromyces ingoldii]|uniref:Uncharacterized protein n=1 Tax=Acaromyces ingoldii TaxID=215250 RepID=A0A316YJX4_9BASI|nr:hypothetical protein FA10DRAFT_267540 [Acaromyces ingoldii]PWN88918.1 hypothetical protein FA10DRAFT_267540 [Acaromyces ingoldii]